MLQIMNNFLKIVDVTFQKLQKAETQLSAQEDNLAMLGDLLAAEIGAVFDASASPEETAYLDSRVSNDLTTKFGQYTIANEAVSNSIIGLDVDAADAFDALTDAEEKTKCITATSFIYLTALNGVKRIKAEQNSYRVQFASIPPHTPLKLKDMESHEFVRLIQKHRGRLAAAYTSDEIRQITQEHKALKEAVVRRPDLLHQIEIDSKQSGFNQVWESVQAFPMLRAFAAGLATIMPTTSRVEADFSQVNYRKDAFCSNLSDFSLEGVMHSKQLGDLEKYVGVIRCAIKETGQESDSDDSDSESDSESDS